MFCLFAFYSYASLVFQNKWEKITAVERRGEISKSLNRKRRGQKQNWNFFAITVNAEQIQKQLLPRWCVFLPVFLLYFYSQRGTFRLGCFPYPFSIISFSPKQSCVYIRFLIWKKKQQKHKVGKWNEWKKGMWWSRRFYHLMLGKREKHVTLDFCQ